MLRAILFFAALSLAAVATLWISEQPGDVTITWLGYMMSMTIPAFAALLVVGYLLAYLSFVLLMLPMRLIRLLSKERRRARDSDYTAMRLAIQTDAAILAEDPEAAEVWLNKLDRMLGSAHKETAALLVARLANLKGMGESESVFLGLLADPVTAPIGYRWLIEYNERKGNLSRALDFARKAKAGDIKAAWIDRALIDLELKLELYEEAAASADDALRRKHLATDEHNALKTRLYLALTARAEDDRTKDEWLSKALKISPLPIETALAAADFYGRTGKRDRALDILKDAWKTAPSWEAYLLYARLLSNADHVEFLKRVEELVKPHASATLAYKAKGDAYWRAKLWGQAKREFAQYLEREEPDYYTMTVLAKIEKSLGNTDAVELWKAKATEMIEKRM